MGVIEPPPYPRTPYLVPPADRPTSWCVSSEERRSWLMHDVVVEEKLDGANVSIVLDSGSPRVASRGGGESMDRARQLGRLKAWANERLELLHRLLGTDLVLYGEWMWLTHSVPYTRLPDWLIVLDLWSPGHGMLPTDERNTLVERAGLHLPPRLFSGVIGGISRLDELITTSQYGDAASEGLVLRRESTSQRCKYVAPGFRQRDDQSWSSESPRHNRLAM